MAAITFGGDESQSFAVHETEFLVICRNRFVNITATDSEKLIFDVRSEGQPFEIDRSIKNRVNNRA